MQDDQQPQAPQPFNVPQSTPPLPPVDPLPDTQPVVSPSMPPAPQAAAASPDPSPAMPSSDPPAPTPEPIVSSSPAPVVTMKSSKRPWLKKPVLIVAGAVVVVALIGGGLVFGLYLPSTPDWVYRESLQNTGTALDTLLNYSQTQANTHYKGSTYDGSFSLKSPGGSLDASLTGASDTSGNANLAFTANVMGEKGSANVRTIHVAGTDSPDVYVQVTGIKPLLDSAGLSTFDDLDGQWIAIDHTILDTYAAQLKGSDSSSTDTSFTTPSYDQVNDAARKMQTVNKTYLFTTDASKAVLDQQRFVATEQVNGRPMNHYTVSFDKTHFSAYVDALATALDSSSLNDWAKKNSNQSLSQMLDLDSLKTEVASSKTSTLDIWTDNQTRLVSKISLKDPSDSSQTFTISQGYTGSSEYPITLATDGTDDSGNPQDGTLGLTLDTKTNKTTLTFDLTSKASDGTTTVDATVHATPSNSAIQVTAPAGAKPVVDILNELGLGGLADPSSSGFGDDPFSAFGASQT